MSNANDRQVGGDHYRQRKFQHWDVTAPYGLFCLLYAASKYCDRFDPLSKDPKLGKEALEKAIHYVEKTIEIFESTEDHKLQHICGQVPPEELVQEYLNSLELHQTLRTALYFILRYQEIADLKSSIQWLRLAIQHYYPNM
jgi:hypothetical protein